MKGLFRLPKTHALTILWDFQVPLDWNQVILTLCLTPVLPNYPGAGSCFHCECFHWLFLTTNERDYCLDRFLPDVQAHVCGAIPFGIGLLTLMHSFCCVVNAQFASPSSRPVAATLGRESDAAIHSGSLPL